MYVGHYQKKAIEIISELTYGIECAKKDVGESDPKRREDLFSGVIKRRMALDSLIILNAAAEKLEKGKGKGASNN